MRHAIIRVLDSPHAIRGATIISLLLGYFFIFVWAPHPWSWQGIDSYHELAKSLARGEQFRTTDVPWGYAHYAAAFYRLFGERIWVPLVVQATLNAAVPALLFHLIAPLAGRRVAVLSALLAGVFSFNTIYASTQASDSICTVMFLAGLVGFAAGARDGRIGWFALSGLLFGLVPQFRPNLVLFPFCLLLGYLLLKPRTRDKLAQVAVFGALVIALQMPWVIRTYRLTGLVLPTSTHGGVQLWYGTLQVGPYLESRAHNPRLHFATPAFPYTSIWWRPIEIEAGVRDCLQPVVPTTLVYWTDRDGQRREVTNDRSDQSHPGVHYTLPPQPNHTALYYYFSQTAATSAVSQPASFTTPLDGPHNPDVVFVSDDHLHDLDQHDDLLDLFDLIRMVRHIAWQEPVRASDKVDLNHDGRIDAADVQAMVLLTVPELASRFAAPASRVEVAAEAVTVRLADGSWISVPHDFGGKQTDLQLSLDGEMAPALMSRWRTFTSLADGVQPRRTDCMPAGDAIVDGPFYLSEPHGMQRYMALAMDNIGRDRVAFFDASIYRMLRLFIIRGSDDLSTSQQFHRSSFVYAAGTILSMVYFGMFLAGVAIAYRRHSRMLALLVPIAYVPLTICFVLTNMRYTVTVQPLMFAFVAAALAAALKLDATPADRPESGER